MHKTPIHLFLNDSDLALLKKWSAYHDVSMAEMVRKALRNYSPDIDEDDRWIRELP